jgi:hypothetical protein
MSHLSQEQIKDLLNDGAAGVDLTNTLLHFESCSICQAKMPSLSNNDLLGIITKETVFNKALPVEKKQSAKINSSSFWGQRRHSGVLKIGFATLLMLCFGVLAIWFLTGKKERQFVENPTNINSFPPSNPANNGSNSNEEQVGINNSNENQNPTILGKSEKKQGKTADKFKPQSLAKNEAAQPSDSSLTRLDKQELAQNLRVAPQSLIGLESPKVIYRNSDIIKNDYSALYPVGEVIGEVQPVLRWKRVKNAASYKIVVYDENYNELFSKDVTQTSLKIEKMLKRGEKYQWQINARIRNGENSTITLPPAIFRVAAREIIGKIKRMNSENNSEWKKANLLFSEGLLSETEKILDNILRKNPQDKFAAGFLQRIKALRKAQTAPIETKQAQ